MQSERDGPAAPVYHEPARRPFTQARARRMGGGARRSSSSAPRFEGVDERVIEARGLMEVSIGDYVLSGGEIAALAMLDACVRLIPGVMGKDASATEESFENGLGEEFFVHKAPFDRSSLTRWRQRMGEEKLGRADPGEPRSVARDRRAPKPSNFSKVIVDTTVQPKAVAFPTDVRLMHRARERLVRLAKKHGVRSRQSYGAGGQTGADRPISATPTPSSSGAPTGRCAACEPIWAGSCETSSARPRAMGLRRIFAEPLSLAFRVRHQRQNQRGRKVYSLHAPEVECIGKGKAHRPTSSASRCRWRPR